MQSLRIALRQLLKTPGFTLIAVLTLALGIGACAAMFGIVNTVLLKPLPVQDPSRLVWIENSGPAAGGLSSRTSQVDTVKQWKLQNQSFEDLAAYNAFFDYSQYTMLDRAGPMRIRAVPVTRNFLEVLGVPPALGRNFVAAEAGWNNGNAPATVLSHRFWQQHFSGDPAVVGSTLTINNQPVQIVGVLPASFDFDAVFAPGSDVDMLLPFPMVEQTQNWGNTSFAVARLKAGVTLAQAQAELDTINARIIAGGQAWGIGGVVRSLEDRVRGSVRPAFMVLSGAVLCVLLIVCLNVSNLLLTRAQARRKDVAVQIALGAGRRQLIARLLGETMLLALAGGGLGLLLAALATSAVPRLQAFNIPLLQTASFDMSAAGFTMLATVLAGVLCSLLPVIALWRGKVAPALTEAGSRGSTSKDAARVRTVLVGTQIALACVLLAGAGSLIRSFMDVLNADLGFQPDQTMSWRADSTQPFRSAEERVQYYQRLVAAARAVPGVDAVGISDTLPLGRDRTWSAGAKGQSYPPGEYPGASPRVIDQNYLQTMRVPLRAGRYFDDRDIRGAASSVIVNQTLANALWAGRDPVGQVLVAGSDETVLGTVVGVVADIPRSFDEAPNAEMYFDFRQMDDWSSVELLVRSQRPADALVPEMRAAMQAFDPTLASGDYIRLHEVIDRAVAPRRLTTSMLGGFSTLALLLAGLGLYGVISYSVGQRDRELAVRMAVGSQRGDMLRLVMGEGLRVAAVGIGVGLLVALLALRLLQHLWLGAGTIDPLVLIINVAVIAAVALLASFIPALRAARTQPVMALR